MYKLRVMLVTFAVTLAGTVFANHQDEATIKQRTMPVGKVYRTGDDVPVAKPAVTETSGPRSGEEVYTAKCAMCHGAGIAGAPKVGDSSSWAARIAQGEATLFEHAINGYQGSAGMMPAKGGCADCSDEEVKQAVRHMVKSSQ